MMRGDELGPLSLPFRESGSALPCRGGTPVAVEVSREVLAVEPPGEGEGAAFLLGEHSTR